MRYLRYGAITRFMSGDSPAAAAAITKVYWSEYHRRTTNLAIDILRVSGLVASGRPPSSTFGVDDPGAPNSTASWQRTFLTARAGTMYAGTSEIQRNIIGRWCFAYPRSRVWARRVLNKWWLPESGNASRCPDMLNRRFVSDFASVVGFFNTLLALRGYGAHSAVSGQN